jgi:hypothetical protein
LSLELSDFWTWQGKVGRAKYVGIGVFLFAIKHNLDRIIASSFDRSWGRFNYWIYNEPNVIGEGQFLLTPLPNAATMLEGTTWYQNRFWPGQYWRLWSDYIIHGIHKRVLVHIKKLSENKS